METESKLNQTYPPNCIHAMGSASAPGHINYDHALDVVRETSVENYNSPAFD
jgi:hypothetical protein